MLRKFGSVKILDRKAALSINEGLSLIKSNLENNYNINVREDRLECFLKKGLSCASCGLKATHFAIERVQSDSYSGYSLSLYAKKPCGAEEYFTKDHKIPKSAGGKNSIENYQTMCWTCNSKKGSLY